MYSVHPDLDSIMGSCIIAHCTSQGYSRWISRWCDGEIGGRGRGRGYMYVHYIALGIYQCEKRSDEI